MIRLRTLCRSTAALSILVLAACAPTHTVKPLPNFVKVGLAPGDRITVITRRGETHEFILDEIRGDRLVGDGVELTLSEIVSIKKHAWSRPESPCGGGEPLGCSVPLLVSLASELHGHYKEKFYDACAQHDYCYRHGFASYGLDREACDEAFLVDMKALCPEPASGGVGKFLEVMDDSVESRQQCETAADDFYAAVRRYGEEGFRTSTSTYCEYDGPPAARSGAANTTPAERSNR